MLKVWVVAESYHLTGDNQIRLYQTEYDARRDFEELIRDAFESVDDCARIVINFNNGLPEYDSEDNEDDMDEAFRLIHNETSNIYKVWFDSNDVFGDFHIFEQPINKIGR